MKKIIALSLSILVLAACKKREDQPSGPDQFIVGYWEMTDLEVTGNLTVAGNPIPITGEGTNYSGGYNLKSDKTADYDASCDVVLNIPGIGQQSFPFERNGSGTWSLANNNTELRVVEGNGTTTIFPIKVLTENIMIVEQDSTFNMGAFSGSINYEVTLEK